MSATTHLVMQSSVDTSIAADRGHLSCLGQRQELFVYDTASEPWTQPHHNEGKTIEYFITFHQWHIK